MEAIKTGFLSTSYQTNKAQLLPTTCPANCQVLRPLNIPTLPPCSAAVTTPFPYPYSLSHLWRGSSRRPSSATVFLRRRPSNPRRRCPPVFSFLIAIDHLKLRNRNSSRSTLALHLHRLLRVVPTPISSWLSENLMTSSKGF